MCTVYIIHVQSIIAHVKICEYETMRLQLNHFFFLNHFWWELFSFLSNIFADYNKSLVQNSSNSNNNYVSILSSRNNRQYKNICLFSMDFCNFPLIFIHFSLCFVSFSKTIIQRVENRSIDTCACQTKQKTL